MHRVLALLLLLVGGCLSVPEARTGDGGPDSARPDGGPDAARACDAPGAGTLFSPVGVHAFFAGQVVDLNCDQKQDLLMLDHNDSPTTQGVYALLGRPRTTFGTRYDGFVPIKPARPMAVHAVDLGGSADLDLVVLAGEDTGGTPDNDKAWLYVFEATGPLTWSERSKIELMPASNPKNEFVPQTGTPSIIASGNFDGDGVPDLVITDYDGVLTAEYDWDVKALREQVLFPVPAEISSGNWGITGVFPVPSVGPARDDLILVHQYYAILYRNSGSGLLPSMPERPVYLPADARAAAIANLDQGQTPDVVSAGGNGAGAVLEEGRNREYQTWRFMATDRLETTDNNLDAMLVGEFIGNASKPELVVLDHTGLPDQALLRVYDDLTATGTPTLAGDLTPVRVRSFAITPWFQREPAILVAGDFDGDAARDLFLFDSRNGDRLCVDLAQNPIVRCP